VYFELVAYVTRFYHEREGTLTGSVYRPFRMLLVKGLRWYEMFFILVSDGGCSCNFNSYSIL
jgi:hypothetical protein